MNNGSLNYMYLALAIIGIGSVFQGQWMYGVVALIAGIGIWLNDMSRRPEYRWLSFAKYLALGIIAFVVVVAFSGR